MLPGIAFHVPVVVASLGGLGQHGSSQQ